MPDFTPYVPLFTAVVAALAALGGVWITTWATRNTAERQFRAEQNREDARLAREDADKAEAADKERVERATTAYREVRELFLGEIAHLRTWVPLPGPRRQEVFQSFWNQDWSRQGEMRLLRSVANIEDDSRRNRLARILDAVSRFDSIGDHFYRDYSWQVETSLKVGFDLSAAWTRGQEIDDELQARFDAVNSDLEEVYEKWRLDDEVRREMSRPKSTKEARKPPTPNTSKPAVANDPPTSMPV